MLIKNYKNFLIYFSIIFVLFLLDRISKLYILNLAEINPILDLYITSYLNIYLVWNSGIGFGLFSYDQSLVYNLITFLILIVNIIIVIMLYKTYDYKVYFFLLILGGSLGNLFDIVYYYVVPDLLQHL